MMNKGQLIMDIPFTVPAGHSNVNRVLIPKEEREKMFSSDYFKELKKQDRIYLYSDDVMHISNLAAHIPLEYKIGKILSFDDNKATVLFYDPDYIETLPYDINEYSIFLNIYGIKDHMSYGRYNNISINYARECTFSNFCLCKNINNPYINITEDMLEEVILKSY